jgi:hypothetical protein
MSLFFSHFSFRKPVCNGKFTEDDHAVDRLVDAAERRFGCSPLFIPGYESFFEIRSTSGKVLQEKNISPSFEDT